MDDPQTAALINLIYDAALDEARWIDVMLCMSDMTHSGSVCFIRKDRQTGVGTSLVARLDERGFEEYFGYFALRNPLSAAIRDMPVGSIVMDRQVMDKPDLMRSEFYNGFMAPRDMHAALGLVAWRARNEIAAISIMRSARAGEFEPRHAAMLRPFIPHIERAAKLANRLQTARAKASGLVEAAHQLRDGLLLLDSSGRLLFANPMAEVVLQRQDGLTTRHGRLTATNPGTAKRLAALIAAAVGAKSEALGGGSLSIARAPDVRPYALLVMPCRQSQDSLLARRPAVIVTVTDLDAFRPAAASALRELLGFTRAEAAVGNLLAVGSDLKEISIALQVSLNTVRRHLSHMMDKTGVGRQAELVRLMLRLPV